MKGGEKIEAEPKKKEEKPVEAPKEPEAKPKEAIEPPKEETPSNATDIINDLYNQLETVGKAIVNIEKQIEALKMNQVWLQQYTTNALKATEVK